MTSLGKRKRGPTIAELRRTLPKLEDGDRVPLPNLDEFTNDLVARGPRSRSVKSLREQTVNRARQNARNFLKYADVIKVPISIDDLTPKVTQASVEEEYQRLLNPNHPIQAMSARWIDKKGKPLLFYLAHRKLLPNRVPKTLSWERQHEGRTLKDLKRLRRKGVGIVHDGLTREQCEKLYEVSQRYAASTQPVMPLRDKRHLLESANPRVMRYSVLGEVEHDYDVVEELQEREDEGSQGEDEELQGEDGGSQDEDEELQGEDGGSQDEDEELQGEDGESQGEEESTDHGGSDYCEDESEHSGDDSLVEEDHVEQHEEQERCGVYHLVHSWIQQKQLEKGLYISHNLTGSGVRIAGARRYLDETSTTVRCIAAMFEVLYPRVYKKYKMAFDAGVWLEEDPGPWLGRAIVYKLQTHLHLDTGDEGPTLKAKLAYAPGDICIFEAWRIFHAVSKWTPKPMAAGDKLTPGRISTVLFCPKASEDLLKGKPSHWGIDSDYGRWPLVVLSYSAPKKLPHWGIHSDYGHRPLHK
ncbi:hypothetical protein DXG01_013907 [Tephrocybe rancida]|nr:hypothetical protein DXG01_013907 [Tephrocybe rancida]